MLSEVGANATTQSKHPGAAGFNNADISHSPRTAVLTADAKCGSGDNPGS